VLSCSGSSSRVALKLVNYVRNLSSNENIGGKCKYQIVTEMKLRLRMAGEELIPWCRFRM